MSQRRSPLDKYLGTLGTGTVQWIGVRPRGGNRCSRCQGCRRWLISALRAITHVQDARVQAPGDADFAGVHHPNRCAPRRSGSRPCPVAPEHCGVGLEPQCVAQAAVLGWRALLEATQLCHPCAAWRQSWAPAALSPCSDMADSAPKSFRVVPLSAVPRCGWSSTDGHRSAVRGTRRSGTSGGGVCGSGRLDPGLYRFWVCHAGGPGFLFFFNAG